MTGIYHKHRKIERHNFIKERREELAAAKADENKEQKQLVRHKMHKRAALARKHTHFTHQNGQVTLQNADTINNYNYHIYNPTPGPINTFLPPAVDRPTPPGQTHYPVLSVEQGRIWGDPHFIGEDGGKFDIMGESGRVYNLLSDTGVQVNGAFGPWKGKTNATVITDLGITTQHGHKITLSESGSLTINGQVLENGGSLELSDGSIVKHNGNNVDVTAAEWDMNIQFASNHLNIDFRSENAFSDGVLPDGLWGQTVDFDTEQRSAIDKQGTGAFYNPLLTYQTYDVGSVAHGPFALHDTSFTNYNTFAYAPIQHQGPGTGLAPHTGYTNVQDPLFSYLSDNARSVNNASHNPYWHVSPFATWDFSGLFSQLMVMMSLQNSMFNDWSFPSIFGPDPYSDDDFLFL